MSQITAIRPEPFVSEGSSPPSSSHTTPGFRPGFTGLRCRSCGTPQETAALFVCPRCFGPLEPTYDLVGLRERLTRETIEARPAGIWRLAELLPVDEVPADARSCRRLAARGGAPTRRRHRARAAVGQGRLPQPDPLVQGPRRWPSRRARASRVRVHTRSPAPAPATSHPPSPRPRPPIGLRAVVFIPADLEPAKVAQARALGATVVRVDGPYDAVNRLCLELTDELEGWAVVNVNLRPYYAEGSKTIAFEIARQLGWRTPDVVVAPLASGSLYTKLAQGVR